MSSLCGTLNDMDRFHLIQSLSPETAQYRESCDENIEFVLEMLEAMRLEADLVGDSDAACFWDGAIKMISHGPSWASGRFGRR